jgi:hypothetical protein
LPVPVRTVLAGLVAGAVFGLVIQFWLSRITGIPLLYGGSRSLVAGWLLHLFHGVVGAAVFVGIVTRNPIARHRTKRAHSMIFGLVYGFSIWVSITVVSLPTWYGFTVPWPGGPLQNFTTGELLGSVIGFSLYGLVLGGSVDFQLWQGATRESESEH